MNSHSIIVQKKKRAQEKLALGANQNITALVLSHEYERLSYQHFMCIMCIYWII